MNFSNNETHIKKLKADFKRQHGALPVSDKKIKQLHDAYRQVQKVNNRHMAAWKKQINLKREFNTWKEARGIK
jgi:hypothetical protein